MIYDVVARWISDSNLSAFLKHDPDTGEIIEKIQLADSGPLPHGHEHLATVAVVLR